MLKYTCTAILVVFWLESCDYVTVLWSLDIQTEKLLNQNKFFEWKQNFWMKIRFLNEFFKIILQKSKLLNPVMIFQSKTSYWICFIIA